MIRVGFFDRGGVGAPQYYYEELFHSFKNHAEVEPIFVNKNTQSEIDLIHFNYIPVHPDPRQDNSIFQNFRKIPKVATKHGDIIWSEPQLNDQGVWYKSVYQRLLQPIMADFTDAIIAVSKDAADRLNKYLKYPLSDIYPIHHGIDQGLFRPIKNAPEYIVNEYNITNDFILHVSNYSKKKNPQVLIKAYEESHDSHDLDLVIVGGRWVDSINFENDNIHIVGRVDQNELPYFYSSAEIFFFPSLHETFGFPNLEAMSCGSPVVTSNAYAIPEIVEDNAIMHKPKDVKSFANTLSRLANSEMKKMELSRKGLEHARQFTWESTANETLDVYKRVLNNF